MATAAAMQPVAVTLRHEAVTDDQDQVQFGQMGDREVAYVQDLDDADGAKWTIFSGQSHGAWTAAAVVTTLLAVALLVAGFLCPALAPILFTAAAIMSAPALATSAMAIATNVQVYA